MAVAIENRSVEVSETFFPIAPIAKIQWRPYMPPAATRDSLPA